MTLPTAPSRTMDQDTFDATTDAFIGALPQFETDMNALAAAMALNATTDTSSSSVAIGTGAKTFTVSASKSFWPGMWLVIADTAAPTTNAMFCQVTSYSGTTLVVNSYSVQGSGTIASWQISQSAPAALGGLYAALAGSASQNFATNALTASGGVQSISASALIGYGTGAGGTVTQTTDKSTAVTINRPSGKITMNNAALAAGATVAFQVNNSTVSAADVPSVVIVGGITSGANYIVRAGGGGTGNFFILLKNDSAGSLSEAVEIQFNVMDGATA